MNWWNWGTTLQYYEAKELAARIRFEFPQFSSVDVIPARDGYAVMVSRWYVKHDRYCCVEYKTFMQEAESHGFEIDIEDNGMLIYPYERTVTITTPGQWEIVRLTAAMSDTQVSRHYENLKGKQGRPRKVA